jgi:hypothetical protein
MSWIRNYNGEIVLSASTIARDVVLSGDSRGWQGSIEDQQEVAKVLLKFNIRYVDDMFGRWEYRP